MERRALSATVGTVAPSASVTPTVDGPGRTLGSGEPNEKSSGGGTISRSEVAVRCRTGWRSGVSVQPSQSEAGTSDGLRSDGP